MCDLGGDGAPDPIAPAKAEPLMIDEETIARQRRAEAAKRRGRASLTIDPVGQQPSAGDGLAIPTDGY